MALNNREIEVKLVALDENIKYADVIRKIKKFLKKEWPDYTEISGRSSDIYWKTPKNSKAGFIRLRKNPHGAAQMTVKSNDKGNNIDRIEVDVKVPEYKQAKEMLNVLMGDSQDVVTKKYKVFFLENDHVNFSVYHIEDDFHVFIEIEGTTLKRVKQLTKSFTEYSGLDFLRVKSSVYNMFVEQKLMKTEPLFVFLEEGDDN